MVKIKFVFVALACFSGNLCFGQVATDSSKTTFHQQDFKDWMVQKKWVRSKPPKNNFVLIIPIVASNPAAGFIFGAGLTMAYKQNPADLRFSNITANATYSTNKLLNLNLKSNVFAAREKLVLNGDWRFLVNYESTYGLGTNRYVPNSGVDVDGFPADRDSLSQNLQYHQVRIHETASWKVWRNIYAGVGIQLDYHYQIQDQTLSQGDSSDAYHYTYSVKHGFNPTAYNTTGVSLNLLLDSRDNQVNTYRGYYANLNYRINLPALGSSRASSTLLAEFRGFINLDPTYQRHILAFWLYGNFVTSGQLPYLMLPALGFDQRQRTGRGYVFGRFRGENLVYQESEYRFPISPHTGILGGVVFLNLTSTSDSDNHIKTLQYVQLGYGGGIRLLLDKKSRTRLELDAGIGQKKLGIYLGAQETF